MVMRSSDDISIIGGATCAEGGVVAEKPCEKEGHAKRNHREEERRNHRVKENTRPRVRAALCVTCLHLHLPNNFRICSIA
jgi:hypothetical protein